MTTVGRIFVAKCDQNVNSSVSSAKDGSQSPTTWWFTNALTKALKSHIPAKFAENTSNNVIIYVSTGETLRLFCIILIFFFVWGIEKFFLLTAGSNGLGGFGFDWFCVELIELEVCVWFNYRFLATKRLEVWQMFGLGVCQWSFCRQGSYQEFCRSRLGVIGHGFCLLYSHALDLALQPHLSNSSQMTLSLLLAYVGSQSWTFMCPM